MKSEKGRVKNEKWKGKGELQGRFIKRPVDEIRITHHEPTRHEKKECNNYGHRQNKIIFSSIQKGNLL